MICFLGGGNFQKVENHRCRKTGRDLHLDRLLEFETDFRFCLVDEKAAFRYRIRQPHTRPRGTGHTWLSLSRRECLCLSQKHPKLEPC